MPSVGADNVRGVASVVQLAQTESCPMPVPASASPNLTPVRRILGVAAGTISTPRISLARSLHHLTRPSKYLTASPDRYRKTRSGPSPPLISKIYHPIIQAKPGLQFCPPIPPRPLAFLGLETKPPR